MFQEFFFPFAKCIGNDLISDFLKFRFPKKLSKPQKILSVDYSKRNGKKRKKRYTVSKTDESRSELRKTVDKKFFAPLLPHAKNFVTQWTQIRKKRIIRLKKLSKLQDMNTIKSFDNLELPVFVADLLSSWPKHPVKDKFNETHILSRILIN